MDNRNSLNEIEHLAPAHPTIVMDNGSYTIKTGYAGEDFPRSITPNIVGTTRSEICDIPFRSGPYEASVTIEESARSYAGHLAKINQGALDTVFPMSHDVITDWEAMEQMWCHIFYEELLSAPEMFNILHTESLLNTMQCREKLVEIMFESFNLPNTAIVPKSVLPLYNQGKVNGLVVDSGYEYTHVVPVESGYPVAHGIRSMPVGGWHVTQYMKQLINERGYDMKTPMDMDYVTEIKEKFGYCSWDFERQQAHLFTEDMEQKYTLPDGRMFKVNSEAFRGPEIMFNPALFNIESHYGGVHDLIYKACSDCRIEEQPNLYRNIVLAGGNSLFPFLSQRLEIMLAQAHLPFEVVIAANPERSYSTWIGGSIIASLSTFDQVWISNGEYKEYGPEIVHTKNYYNI